MALNYLELLDWRRTVAELFAELRQRPPDVETLAWFRSRKDRLYREHPQSPIPVGDRAVFRGLNYWAFDEFARVEAELVATGDDGDAETKRVIEASEARLRPIGDLHFELNSEPHQLRAYWIEQYGGGVFVPFRDATSGFDTYGGGRYVLDTVKSADLGSDYRRSTLVLDFNYAYHPSCVYDPMYVCPLAPPENRLPVAVRAGERLTRAVG